MSDLTQEAEIGYPEDAATGVDLQPGAETALVPNAFATELAELAWSHEDAWADISTSRDGLVPEKRALPKWVAAITAVLTAGAAAVWLGTVLYREEAQPIKTPVAAPTPTTTSAPTPTVSAPPTVLFPTPPTALPPPEAPHPAPKYPWVSVAVSQPANATHKRAVSYAFGTTADAALQRAIQDCQTASKHACSEAATVVDGCVVAALGNDTYEGGSGPTRATALADTKANFPWAMSFYTYCSWDGNGS